jgi:hypothetical protein
MNASRNWPRNRLLLALPSRDLNRILPELEHIRCQRQQVLADADSSLDHVFFPDSGVVSVGAVYADGGVIETATIGREGCTGVQAFFGAKTSSVVEVIDRASNQAKLRRKHAKYLDTRSGRLRLAMIADNSAASIAAFVRANVPNKGTAPRKLGHFGLERANGKQLISINNANSNGV